MTLFKNEQKGWTYISPKKIYEQQIIMWKKVYYHTSSGDCRLKQYLNTSMYL